MPSNQKQRDQVIEKRVIEGLIADGHNIVVYDGQVLQLDSWMEKHPGGSLALQHMVGNDATSEIMAYHSDKTLRTMTAYRIGRMPADWTNFTPPIRGGVFRKVNAEVRAKELWTQLTDESNLTVADADVERVDVVALSASNLAEPSTLPTDRDYGISLAMQAEIDQCLASFPSPDPVTQRDITIKYQALHQSVHDGGYYTSRYSDYGRESIRYGFLFVSFAVLLHFRYYIPSALCLGAFWQQIMFTAHDAGHRAITQNRTYDTMIGIFIADFCCGLSFGWWKSSHNVHHLVTNAPEHDPDIQNTPLFATCPSQFKDVHSTYYNFRFVWDKACEVVIPYQKYIYYPIMALARFNLYALGWCHIISNRSKNSGAPEWARYAEIVGMTVYWYVYGYLLVLRTLPDWPTRVAFVLASHMVSLLLHVQITLSHWGMPTCQLGNDESFAQKQLRTTMDVLCPVWLDWLHGGLQFQAIHHLFPRVPRHNLRKLQPMVQEFCKATGIQYQIYGFVDGNKTVVNRLGDISKQLAMLAKCQDHMATTGESGLH